MCTGTWFEEFASFANAVDPKIVPNSKAKITRRPIECFVMNLFVTSWFRIVRSLLSKNESYNRRLVRMCGALREHFALIDRTYKSESWKHQQDAEHDEQEWPNLFEEFAPGPLNLGETFCQCDSPTGQRKTLMLLLNV